MSVAHSQMVQKETKENGYVHVQTHTHAILVVCGFHICELADLLNSFITPKSILAVLQQSFANMC